MSYTQNTAFLPEVSSTQLFTPLQQDIVHHSWIGELAGATPIENTIIIR